MMREDETFSDQYRLYAIYNGILGRYPNEIEHKLHMEDIKTRGIFCELIAINLTQQEEFFNECNSGLLKIKDRLVSLYIGLLDRLPDPSGYEFWLNKIKAENSFERTVKQFVVSEEFSQRCSQIPGHIYIHYARLKLFRQLPKANRIIDLGGAHGSDERGALIGHGYKYRPIELIIVDLPEEQMMFKPSIKMPKNLEYEGISIKYVFQSMEDLAWRENNSVDMVFCGESIEHIEKKLLPKLLSEIKRVLVPGGIFIFDTPNRVITKLQVPKGFIHPEHKYEYKYNEMYQILVDNGYEITETYGLCDCSKSLKGKKFLSEDLYKADLNKSPGTPYLCIFYAKPKI